MINSHFPTLNPMLVVLLLSSLTACGGGGGGATPPATVPIVGNTNTAAVIAGDLFGSATEDDVLTTVGTLSIVDPDSGEANFTSQTLTQGNYGTFTVDTAGQWSFALSNELAEVQALSSAQNLTDSFTVRSADNTSAQIIITITGTDETPVNVNVLLKGQIGDNDSVPTVSCDIVHNSISAIQNAVDNNFAMIPGQTICLASGNYSGLELNFGGIGTETLPITVAAQVPGSVTITGEISIAMTGEYVVLQGFIFKDGSQNNQVIQTRANSNTVCNHCRITENSLINMDAGMSETTKWVYIYGSDNRIDHNWFSGKTTRGAWLVIDRYLADGVVLDETFEVDRAQIDHNYFGDRPPANGKAYADSSDNEYEAIRIGTSDSHTQNSYSVVEHNYFERIQGEAEVISNKSGHNTIRHNTIRDSHGSIVTRHGEYATIENNFIFGDDHPFSGGIRVIDGNHTIVNNYIEGARYQDSNWNGGIVLTGGNGSTSNGYQDVENILVVNNTIVDSVNSLNFLGGNNSNKPDSVKLINNIIANAVGPVIKNATSLPTNSTFSGNIVFGQQLADDDNTNVSGLNGMTFVTPLLEKTGTGLYRPSTQSPNLAADQTVDISPFTYPTHDMDGQLRSSFTSVGADEVLPSTITRGPLMAELVGPLSYTPPTTSGHVVSIHITNHDFDSTDFTGWINTGAEIIVNTDEVFSRGSSVKVDSAADAIEQTLTVSPNTNYTFSAFVKGVGGLSVTAGENVYSSNQISDTYKFTSVSFNSETATEITIKASLPQEISNKAVILNPKFDNAQTDWGIYEGTGIGQVQDSSNSSDSTDGSIKFKYNADDFGTPYDPYIAQSILVLPNTDYTLTSYSLLKSSQSGSTVLFGAYVGDDESLLASAAPSAIILASKESIYSDLDAAGAMRGDDSFIQDTLSFNSGENSDITIFSQFKTTTGDEIRVDEFELTYQGPPATGSVAYFDSFRLVTHGALD